MNFTKPVAMVFFAATLTTVFTQENGWRGIVPLHSTRKDVEALLGSPKESRSVASTFQSKDGRIRVFYSSGFCREGAANDWNVPADTVVTFIFEPNRNLMFADLKLNKTKYERVLDHHVQGAVHYFIRKKVSVSVPEYCEMAAKMFRQSPMNPRQRITTYDAETLQDNSQTVSSYTPD